MWPWKLFHVHQFLSRCEAYESDRIQLIQKHETELTSQKLQLQTQLSADKGVIATLQGIVKEQYATIEKLQNDVINCQSSEPLTPVDPDTPVEEVPPPVNRIVR